MKKFFFLIFVVLFLNVISSLSIGEFFSDIEVNPENYYVIYNEDDSFILENSKLLAQKLGVEFSSEFIDNKNYILVIVPPNLMGYFYWYENNYSYLSLFEEEVNLLMIYLSDLDRSPEVFYDEVTLVFNELINLDLFLEEDFYLFEDFSFNPILSYSCQGFSSTSIFEKNIFEVDGAFFEDVCLDEKTLLKMNCNENLNFDLITCDYSCFQGRCLEESLEFFSTVRSWVQSTASDNYFQRFLNLFRR